jgi:AhpD family alkylhydroperoxidase
MNPTAPINDQITTHFGGEHWPEVFKRVASNEDVMHAIWNQYRTVMSEGEVDVPTKELIGLCVGVTKPNEYIIGLQMRRVRRVGVDDMAEQEALSVAGFIEGLNAFAHALHIDSDLRPRQLEAGDTSSVDREIDVNIPYVFERDDPIVDQVYEEIQSALNLSFVPNIFKAMAHQPAMMQAKWESYKAIMLEGTLPERTKELLAVAVSAVNGCSYCVDAHSTTSRRFGVTPQALVEAACVVDLFANLCTLAKGFRLGKRNF